MQITITLTKSHAQTNEKLIKGVRQSIETFFGGLQDPSLELSAVICSVGTGGRQEQLIRLVPTGKARPPAVSVSIWTHNGSQAATATLQLKGYTQLRLQELIKNGPYFVLKSGRKGDDAIDPPISVTPEVVAGVESVGDDTVIDNHPIEVSPPASVEVAEPVSKKVVDRPRMTPLQFLRHHNVSESDVERLRATMSTIVCRELKEKRVNACENLVQVPVVSITRAIMEHMGLSPNDSGNYRGVIANFYSSRISLFGLKYDMSRNEEDTYTDWIIDCLLIQDFVGGFDTMQALSRTREQELARQAVEAEVADVVPSEAPINVEMMSLDDLLLWVKRWREGGSRIDMELQLQSENADLLAMQIMEMEDALATLRLQLDAANAQINLLKQERSSRSVPTVVQLRIVEAMQLLQGAAAQIAR